MTSSIDNSTLLFPGGVDAVAPDAYATAPGLVAGSGTHEETGHVADESSPIWEVSDGTTPSVRPPAPAGAVTALVVAA